MSAETFCPDALTRKHLVHIRGLVRDAGFEVTAADEYLLGAFANGAARFEQLAQAVSEADDDKQILVLLDAERRARAELLRFVDALDRHYAGAALEDAAELRRTGTEGNVLDFVRVRSAVGQRIVAAVSRAQSGLTREELRKRVSGSKAGFLKALRECVKAGAIRRTGAGRRGSPHRYWTS